MSTSPSTKGRPMSSVWCSRQCPPDRANGRTTCVQHVQHLCIFEHRICCAGACTHASDTPLPQHQTVPKAGQPACSVHNTYEAFVQHICAMQMQACVHQMHHFLNAYHAKGRTTCVHHICETCATHSDDALPLCSAFSILSQTTCRVFDHLKKMVPITGTAKHSGRQRKQHRSGTVKGMQNPTAVLYTPCQACLSPQHKKKTCLPWTAQ